MVRRYYCDICGDELEKVFQIGGKGDYCAFCSLTMKSVLGIAKKEGRPFMESLDKWLINVDDATYEKLKLDRTRVSE